GLLSGVGLGADWSWTDDLLDPTRGWVTSASVEPVGGFLGGKFSFVRLQGEGRRYQPLVADLAAAFRLRLGAEEPFGGSRDVPLFERLYAGGIGSVRGYERRHVGPLLDDDPRGGRSPGEGSAGRRHRGPGGGPRAGWSRGCGRRAPSPPAAGPARRARSSAAPWFTSSSGRPTRA